MQIETRRLSDIKPYPNNPRKNDNAVAAVAESIRQCGYCAPIIVDEDGIILAGHTRLKALKKLGWEKAEVVVRDGLTEEQKRKYRLLDNKTNELAAWDMDLLTAELESIDFEGFDFGFETNESVTDIVEDEAPEAMDGEPTTKPGDIWQLGRHRLMCGDSTDVEAVTRLMDGAKCNLLFTSPPYSDLREYNGGKDLDVANLKTFIGTYKQHCKVQAVNLGIVRRNGEIIRYWDEYIEYAKGQELKLLAWNVWDKLMCGSVGMQSAMVPIRHEWIFVFGENEVEINTTWEKSAGSEKNKKRPTRKVRQADGSMKESSRGDTSKPLKKMESVVSCLAELGSIRSEHPATFPVELPAEYIKAFTDRNDKVADPFGGSGTTLIACEQLGRTCYTMELDSKYCDVIIKRWEALTGETATLVSNA